ncbi:MAG TPA: zinc ribbon domain-containing protein [Spirochaetota bacterium]|nr:zinc ribbon domain-containing protein [Spirochaetota bacterium]
MSKPQQNFLAANSDGTIAYICGKCHNEVAKDAKVCKNCGAKLGSIRCPFCNFKGEVSDFKDDTCPKCGRKNQNLNEKLKPKESLSSVPDSSKTSETNLSQRYFFFFFIFLTISLLIILGLFVYHFDLY